MQNALFAIIASASLLGAPLTASAQFTFIAPGSTWRYLDNGSDQGTAWQSPSFDDLSWASGAAQLGYGDGDEATIISFGPNAGNKYITTYFRQSFWVTNAAQVTNLVLRVLADDGAVAYINGVEVARVNMPAGPISYLTTAVAATEDVWMDVPVSSAALVSGQNLLAVEIHQVSGASSDLSFDAALFGTVGPGAIPPTIVSQPQSQVVAAGSDVTFSVVATGTPPLTYRWRRNGLTIPGATNSNLTLFNVQTNNAGNYSVVVGNSAGMRLSSNAVLTVVSSPSTNLPPNATLTLPTNGSVFPDGADIVLQATASDADGRVVRVDFLANGAKVADAVSPAGPFNSVWSNAPAGSFELTAVAIDDVGNSGSSAPVQITVGTPPVRPTIVTQPQSQTVMTGADVTFDVAVTGTPPFTYRWRRNGATVSVSTNSALRILNVQTNHAGVYSVVVSNRVGAALSSNALLTVMAPTNNFPPSVAITTPTNGARFAGGESVLIEASASDSDGSVTRVEFFADSLTNKLGEDLDAPYQFTWSGAAAGNHRLFAVAVDDDEARTTSAAVDVLIGGPPVSTVVIAPRGGVWRYLDDGTDQGAAWSQPGFNDAAWPQGAAQLGFGDGDEVTVLRRDPGNPYVTAYFRKTFVTTNVQTLNNITLHLLRDDGAVVYINGTEVVRQNMPAGPVNYQTLATVTVGGEEERSIFFPAPVPSGILRNGVNTIAVEVHQAALTSSDLSFDFELTGESAGVVPPFILAHPQSQAVLRGGNVTLRVEAGGTQPLSFQWRRNGVHLSGETNSTLTVFGIETNSAFDVIVANSAGSLLSATALISVIEPNRPPIANNQSLTISEDDATLFSLASGDPDGDTLQYVIGTPAHGSLVIGPAPNQVTYTPDPNFHGSDSFDWQAFDGELYSDFATVTITILPENDAPVARLRIENVVSYLGLPTVIAVPPASRGHDDDEDDDNDDGGGVAPLEGIVILDGSESSDVDGDSLQYLWSAGNPPIRFAGGVRVTNIVETGTYSFLLEVSDGIALDSDAALVHVLGPCDAIDLLVIRIDESPLRRQTKRALVKSLRLACASFDKGRPARGIDSLVRFQEKVAAQVGDSDLELTELLTGAAQTLIDALAQP